MSALIDSAIRLQVLLERVKAGETKQIDAFLRNVDKDLRERLTRGEITANQRARIDALLVEVHEMLVALYDRHSAAYLERMAELSDDLAGIETKSLAAALQGVDVASPVASTLRVAVTAAPLSVRGPGGGMLLDRFVAKWGEADIERIEGTIRRGYFEGRTTEQVVRDLRGTKAANYGDGVLAVNRRHARTVAHTALQHVAHVARAQTWKANEDVIKGYRWVSTLDSQTSNQCMALDGQIFEVGDGPMPPAHPNCRSTVVAVSKTWRELGIDLDEIAPGTRASEGGQVSATLSYFDWLKTQSAEFQIEALGETRAQLFRDGGLSVVEFAKLQLGRNFEPLTLAQMRERAPLVFKRAGV